MKTTIVSLAMALVCGQSACAGELALWYERPAKNWMTEMLPIGNGRLGAMITGGIAHDRIQFNENSLWTGDGNPSGRRNHERQGQTTDSVSSHRKQ